jgi:hypothetical protein
MGMRDWSGDATKIFKGKTVRKIEYLTDDEMNHMGWDINAPVIVFTDGSWIIASSDDEGNDAGALFTSAPKMNVIPRNGR